MPKKTSAPSSEGKRSPGALPKSYALNCAAKEGHGHPIYCVSFSRHVHTTTGDGTAACFATCGGPYATIYELKSSPDSDTNDDCSGNDRPPLTARQIYRDVDDGEVFHACAFGGRGVGSPAGNAAMGVVDRGGVVYFGKYERQRKESSHSERPGKRRRRDDHQARDAPSSGSQFLLPYSETQNGPPLLCLGGNRGVVKVIDTCRRALFMTLSGHGNEITDLKFSPTNEWLLLSASKDESIRLWNLRRGVNVAVFTGHNGHRGQVLGVSWHLDGTRFASCGMDNMIKLWNVLDGDDRKSSHGSSVEAALNKSYDVTPDGEFETIFQQFPCFSTNQVHTDYVDCIQFVGDLILSKSVHNKVVLWKPLMNGEGQDKKATHSRHRAPSSILFLREFKLEYCDNWYVRFDSSPPNHNFLALGNQRGDVKVWSLDENETERHDTVCELATTEWFCDAKASNRSTVRMVAFNPHGSHLVAVRDDSTVWVWCAA